MSFVPAALSVRVKCSAVIEIIKGTFVLRGIRENQRNTDGHSFKHIVIDVHNSSFRHVNKTERFHEVETVLHLYCAKIFLLPLGQDTRLHVHSKSDLSISKEP